jgi:hypothetical protein
MRKSKFPDNQGKCCDAVLRILEERKSATRSALTFPEKERHPAPVELVCMIGLTRYALEHTKIEAYPDQMQDGTHFTDALEHLETSLIDVLPKHAWYMLVVPTNAFKDVTVKEADAIGEKVSEWVIRTAQLLKPTDRQMESLSENIDGVPFRLTLQATIGISDLYGKLSIARSAPADLEALRASRIEQMLVKKLPKLQVWANDDAHTVLILESEDIALTNHQVVLEALKLCLPVQSFCPEYVFFVYATGSSWIVQTLISERQFPTLSYQWWPYRKFNVSELSDLLA